MTTTVRDTPTSSEAAPSSCPKYDWCTDDFFYQPDHAHTKRLGFGLFFVHDDIDNKTYVSWVPSWGELEMGADDIAATISPIRHALATLETDFAAFVAEVNAEDPTIGTLRYEMRSCAEPGCVEIQHEWLGDEPTESHVLERIIHPVGRYVVHGSKLVGDEWHVWVDADGLPESPQLSAAIAQLAGDVQRMQERVDALNGRAIQRHAEPIEHPEGA